MWWWQIYHKALLIMFICDSISDHSYFIYSLLSFIGFSLYLMRSFDYTVLPVSLLQIWLDVKAFWLLYLSGDHFNVWSEEDLLEVVERSHQIKRKTNEWKQRINKIRIDITFMMNIHQISDHTSITLIWLICQTIKRITSTYIIPILCAWKYH